MYDDEESRDGARVPLLSSSEPSTTSMSSVVPLPPPPMPSQNVSVPRSSDEELTAFQINHVLNDFAEKEDATLVSVGLGRLTWSRYLVEKYFAKYKWYNPNRDNEDAPSLSKGWAYFEHFTLPRRYKQKVGGHHIRAPPGEAKNTKLYSPLLTPQESLSDWGIGMGMYFASLRMTFVIFILAGFVNISNIIYYGSNEYDPGQGLKSFGLMSMVQFSAICTDREWVVCSEPDGETKCSDTNYWETIFTENHYGTTTDANGEKVTLINRTTCNMAELMPGMVNYGGLMILIICMLLLRWYLDLKEVRFDEDKTTPSDYTLVVRNPPSGTVDPDVWKNFFCDIADEPVTLCTVALNNEQLVAKLVQRRNDIKMLKRCLPKDIELEFDGKHDRDVDTAVETAKNYREFEELLGSIVTPLLRCLGLTPTETVIWGRIKTTTEEIKELQKCEYEAAAVYVTFETEQGQRAALEALNASRMEIATNTAINIDSSALFQGKVLRVEEAGEPNAVRWGDLQFSDLSRSLRELATMGITLILVVISAFVLHLTRTMVSTVVFSVILSTFNSIIPAVVRLLVSYEKHDDEGSSQTSLYLKITVFRWVNTVIVTRWTTPTLATLGDGSNDLIKTVNALMISEMLVSPLLRYFDCETILNRHYFAPRAKTEEELFGYFNGGWYNLAERFTDFTKVLLLCTFYSAFYPLIYFLGAGILFFQYWTDKFLLLRSWQKAPMIGPETSQFSRTYFNTLALLLGTIASTYAYFGSPFTMLCNCAQNNKECILPATLEFTNVIVNNGTVLPTLQASNDNEGYYFCNQESYNRFPPLPKGQGPNKWMTGDQEQLSRLYGMTCVVLLLLYCVFIVGERVVSAALSLVKGVYEPSGYDQHKDFSSGMGRESFAYVPQLMEVPGFHFPLLICNIDDVDVRLIGWKDPNFDSETDPHRNYDIHNLIFDVPHKTLKRSRNKKAGRSSKPHQEKEDRPIYSVVKHYPPQWALVRENH